MASTRAQYEAARHIGHGSQLVYSSHPASTNVPSVRHAARIAFTSACAVGSYVAVTEFAPSPTIRPSCTITAPNGPPVAPSTFSVASAIARRRNSGLGAEPILNLLNSSPSGESKHSMAYAFRSTRVLTPRGLAPATLLVEGERITG